MEYAENLARALSLAQAEFAPVPKTKTAKVRMKDDKGEYSYQYADFADILKMALPILGKHGLAFSQPLKRKEGSLYLVSRLLFGASEVIESDGLLLPENLTPQLFGSMLTYWRRYDGCSLLGIAPDEDDDGKSTNGAEVKKVRRGKEVPDAPDGLPAVKCEDCGRGVIGYSGPDGPITMGQALAVSRNRWEKDLCGGCQIKWDRKEKEGGARQKPVETELLDMEGELRARGTITQLFPTKNSFSFRLGEKLLFSCFHKSQIAALTAGLNKSVEFVYAQSKDGKYRNVDRICVIDGKAFAHPLEIQEHETAVV